MNGEYHNELVFVENSPIQGRGLFAACALAAGQLIGVYRGPVVEEDGAHVLWIESDEGDDWIGYDGQNEMRFMNHTDQPNAEMDGLNCYALENIDHGEEITIDYGWE
jgi:SET domain-containing protein